MGYGNIVMFAFREFFVEVIGKSLVPYTDIDRAILKAPTLVKYSWGI